jgi:hypothetical protein
MALEHHAAFQAGADTSRPVHEHYGWRWRGFQPGQYIQKKWWSAAPEWPMMQTNCRARSGHY